MKKIKSLQFEKLPAVADKSSLLTVHSKHVRDMLNGLAIMQHQFTVPMPQRTRLEAELRYQLRKEMKKKITDLVKYLEVKDYRALKKISKHKRI
jgi:hypothetical protein